MEWGLRSNSNGNGIIMAQYTGIQGQNILIVSSDPANPIEGQIWYNSTSNLLKGYQFAAVNAWASGGNLATARRYLGGCGTQPAGLAFGGNTGSGATGATEEFTGPGSPVTRTITTS